MSNQKSTLSPKAEPCKCLSIIRTSIATELARPVAQKKCLPVKYKKCNDNILIGEIFVYIGRQKKITWDGTIWKEKMS